MIPNSLLLKIRKHFQTNIFQKFKHRVQYYICFCKAAAFVSGVVFSYRLVRLVILNVIITYLTSNSSDYNLKRAAVFTNFLEGLSAILVIFATRILYSTNRPILMIISSNTSSVIALLLFYMREKHILESGKDVFIIIGIILLAVGDAGLKPVLGEFLTDQLREHGGREGGKKEEQVRAQKKVWWRFAWCCSVVVGFFIYNELEWRGIFQWAGLIMVFTFILFLAGICCYHSKKFSGSSPFVIFRVVKNSVRRRHLMYPSSADQFFDNDHRNQIILSPRVKFFRWLDKAALKESADAKEVANGGKICTVAEVRESKLVLKVVPMWISFLVFGMVSSGVDTFLPEQGFYMQPKEFLTFLLVFRPIFREMISYLSLKLISRLVADENKGKAQIVRIFIGMVLSTFCCTVAWRVEVHRLIIVNEKGLLDKPDEDVPMSIFWLVPQFCLLGLMEGLAKGGLDEFISIHFPRWTEDHGSAINDFVVGIGSFLNIAFISSNKTLFAITLNRSRLDKYYMRLAILAYINMCYNFYLATLYMQWAQPDTTIPSTNNNLVDEQLVNDVISPNNLVDDQLVIDGSQQTGYEDTEISSAPTIANFYYYILTSIF